MPLSGYTIQPSANPLSQTNSNLEGNPNKGNSNPSNNLTKASQVPTLGLMQTWVPTSIEKGANQAENPDLEKYQ